MSIILLNLILRPAKIELSLMQSRQMKLGRLIVLQADTLTVTIKLCYHGNLLFSSPHQSVFNLLVIFSSEKLNQAKTSTKPIYMFARSFIAYEASLASIKMEGQNWPEKLLALGGLESSMLQW